MPSSYGAAFDPTTPSKLASGTTHDAAVRRFRNVFNLATNGGGGTQNSLKIAHLREGTALCAVELSSSVSLTGVNFTVGTLANPTKYAVALAGPAAGATVRFPILPAALAADALSAPEEIFLFPSANTPGAGTVVAQGFASHR